MTTVFGYPRFHYDVIGSTNDIAREMAARRIEEGALVIAAAQTSGRGRRGSAWHTEVGQAALMSFVLYPKVPQVQLWRLGFLAATGVVEALRNLGAEARIKWPNDVLLNARKLCGILVETHTVNETAVAILGIGINVAQETFPGSGSYPVEPVSLRMVLGDKAPDVPTVIEAVCKSLTELYANGIGNDAWPRVFENWHKNLIVGRDQSGVSMQDGQAVIGRLLRVREEDGAAELQVQSGERIFAGPSVLL